MSYCSLAVLPNIWTRVINFATVCSMCALKLNLLSKYIPKYLFIWQCGGIYYYLVLVERESVCVCARACVRARVRVPAGPAIINSTATTTLQR
jgi:hypothetical protein